MNVIQVDGQLINIGVSSLKRGAAVLDGSNAGRFFSGRMQRDIIGTYYNYDITFNTSHLSPKDYDTLYEVLTAPVESHKVVLPYGQGTKEIEMYISNASDVLTCMTDKEKLWSKLEIKFTAMEPQRRP